MFKYLFYVGLPLIMVFSIVTATAEDSPASLLESHLWEDRIIILIAPSMHDADFNEQVRLLDTADAAMRERDIVTYHIIDKEYVKRGGRVLPHVPSSVFIDAMGHSADHFSIQLIGKDGDIKHTQRNVWQPDAIIAMIDAMPMRQREMAE